MNKVKISNNAFLYPMPMVVVGAQKGTAVNFMAVGWVARVNASPPMIAIAINNAHLTHEMLHESGAFSVCIPSAALLEKTDCCGLISGRKADKAKLFNVFYGTLPYAPMIEECPICMECSMVTTVKLPTNTLFIGEIVGCYAEERILTDGKPDITKLEPATLSMPDNRYWAVGDCLGKAWSMGRNLLESLRSDR